MHQLPTTGFLRLRQIIGDKKANPPIIGLIPISRSTWYSGVKAGIFPQKVQIGRKAVGWRVEEILDLIRRLAEVRPISK